MPILPNLSMNRNTARRARPASGPRVALRVCTPARRTTTRTWRNDTRRPPGPSTDAPPPFGRSCRTHRTCTGSPLAVALSNRWDPLQRVCSFRLPLTGRARSRQSGGGGREVAPGRSWKSHAPNRGRTLACGVPCDIGCRAYVTVCCSAACRPRRRHARGASLDGQWSRPVVGGSIRVAGRVGPWAPSGDRLDSGVRWAMEPRPYRVETASRSVRGGNQSDERPGNSFSAAACR